MLALGNLDSFLRAPVSGSLFHVCVTRGVQAFWITLGSTSCTLSVVALHGPTVDTRSCVSPGALSDKFLGFFYVKMDLGFEVDSFARSSLDIISTSPVCLAAHCSVSASPDEYSNLGFTGRRLRENALVFSAVGPTVDTRPRDYVVLNFTLFLLEGGPCVLSAVCGTQLDHAVPAVGYGTGLVLLMVHVGFKGVLTDGELSLMPAFVSILALEAVHTLPGRDRMCSQQRGRPGLVPRRLPRIRCTHRRVRTDSLVFIVPTTTTTTTTTMFQRSSMSSNKR